MTDEHFQHLATLYCEGAIDAPGLELLNAELSQSAERVRQFNDLRLLLGVIYEHGRGVCEAPVDTGRHRHAGDAVRAVSRSGENDGARQRRSHPRSRVGLPAGVRYALIATAVVVAAGLYWRGRGRETDVHDGGTTSLARLTYQSDAEWSEPRDLGSPIGVEMLKLNSGLAKLDFSNGACVTLEGPAEFQILGPKQTLLRSGILTAHVPESAVGFSVETPALEVIDRGTSFGVAVGADGLTNVAVFEGEIDVNSNAVGPSPIASQRVVEGHAIRAAQQSSEIEAVEIETQPFERVWPINSGVLDTAGPMKFVSPGPTFVPGRYQDNEHIVVFPERRGLLLEAPVTVDQREPGEYVHDRTQSPPDIHAGHRIRSYLLQLNLGGRAKSSVMGQITFDRPILGLVFRAKHLASTDATLGHPNGIYDAKFRGLEPPHASRTSDRERDNVILTADRSTLILSLAKGSGMDQIRVIVDDDVDGLRFVQSGGVSLVTSDLSVDQ